MENSSHVIDRFFCISCKKSFNSKKGLRIHVHKLHHNHSGVRAKVENMECLETGCSFRCRVLADLRLHLSNCHGHSFAEMVRQFCNIEEFEIWLRNFEKQNDVEFYKNTMNVNQKSKVVYYRCNRSGFYRESKKRVQRHTKLQGSCKIEGYCTAYIKTKEDFVTSAVTMSMCNTHYGHQLQLMHLRLPKEDKRLITEKLNMGLTLMEVINEVKKTKPPMAERTNMIKQRDVYNVINKLSTKPKIVLDADHMSSNANENLAPERPHATNECDVTNSNISIFETPIFDQAECNDDVQVTISDELVTKRLTAILNLKEIIKDVNIADLETVREIFTYSEALKEFIKTQLNRTTHSPPSKSPNNLCATSALPIVGIDDSMHIVENGTDQVLLLISPQSIPATNSDVIQINSHIPDSVIGGTAPVANLCSETMPELQLDCEEHCSSADAQSIVQLMHGLLSPATSCTIEDKTYLISGEDGACVLTPSDSSFNKPGRTCYVHVDNPLQDQDMNIVIA